MVWWATVTGDTVGIPPEVREPKPSDEATTNRLGQSNALKLSIFTIFSLMKAPSFKLMYTTDKIKE